MSRPSATVVNTKITATTTARRSRFFSTTVDPCAAEPSAIAPRRQRSLPGARVITLTTPPSASAWMAVMALAVVCTGVAYVLYFRLIASVGAANAMSVTFLIPAFAVLWGWVFLDESVNATMVGACAVILVGTGLVTGLITERGVLKPEHAALKAAFPERA